MSNQFVIQLQASIKRKQKKSPQFSLRLLAQRIGLSHSFLSQVLSGKKNFPMERLDCLMQELDLDDFAQRRLFDSIVETQLAVWSAQSKALAQHLRQAFSGKNQSVRVYKEVPSSQMTLINPWYHMALLDLVSSADFKVSFPWMARRLGISAEQAQAAWVFLKENQFVAENQGRWEKSEQYLRLPVKNSTASIREHYRQILGKIDQQLKNKNSEADVKKRLIVGASCTANLEKLSDVSQYLEDSLYLAAEELSEGDCQEVYYLMVSAIPLSIKE